MLADEHTFERPRLALKRVARTHRIRVSVARRLGRFLPVVSVGLLAALLSACGGPTSALRRVTGSANDSEHDGVVQTACGAYTRVDEGMLGREAELDGMPFLDVVLGTDDPCAPLPLVVVLHGLGAAPVLPRWPYADLGVAVRIVLPRGPVRWGRGYAWSSVRVLDHEPEGLAATLSVQADRVASFLDALVADRAVLGRVFLTGFSQGAHVALATTMRRPEHVGLLFVLAGWAPPELRAPRLESSPPIRWMHGLEDERVPYELALECVTDLRSRGHDVELVGIPGGRHAMSDAMDERFHGWLARALRNQAEARPLTEGLQLDP